MLIHLLYFHLQRCELFGKFPRIRLVTAVHSLRKY